MKYVNRENINRIRVRLLGIMFIQFSIIGLLVYFLSVFRNIPTVIFPGLGIPIILIGSIYYSSFKCEKCLRSFFKKKTLLPKHVFPFLLSKSCRSCGCDLGNPL